MKTLDGDIMDKWWVPWGNERGFGIAIRYNKKKKTLDFGSKRNLRMGLLLFIDIIVEKLHTFDAPVSSYGLLDALTDPVFKVTKHGTIRKTVPGVEAVDFEKIECILIGQGDAIRVASLTGLL